MWEIEHFFLSVVSGVTMADAVERTLDAIATGDQEMLRRLSDGA